MRNSDVYKKKKLMPFLAFEKRVVTGTNMENRLNMRKVTNED
jgi:hypothetical protein